MEHNLKFHDKLATVGFELTAKTIDLKLPLLPIETLQQINSFLRWASKKHNCEAIVSLTLDDDGHWIVIPWHQKAQGQLHIKFDQQDADNIRDYGHLEAQLNKVHCTIHSHNKTNAFQSSDDADDEIQKNGWHMTIGNCDKEPMSWHSRYNFKRNAQFNNEGEKVANAMQEFVTLHSSMLIHIDLPEHLEDYRQLVLEGSDTTLGEMNKSIDHPPEWEAFLTKSAYSGTNHTTYQGGTGRGYTQSYMGQGAWGMGDEREEIVVELQQWRAEDLTIAQ